MRIGIIIGVIVVIGIVLFILISKNNTKLPVAKKIQLQELESVITQLLDGEMEYDFFGITSDGTDCIYFIDSNGKINIEYEVMTNNQKPFVEKISTFAKKNNYKMLKTTYGNPPQYSDLKEAPVYRLELNTDKYEATKIGNKIMLEIFNKNESTRFDVVP